MLDIFIKNPGFQYIAEDVFNILDKQSVLNSGLVNHSWRAILYKPTFWLKKLKSENTAVNFNSWEMFLQNIEEDEIKEDIVNLLIKMFKQKTMSPLEIVTELGLLNTAWITILNKPKFWWKNFKPEEEEKLIRRLVHLQNEFESPKEVELNQIYPALSHHQGTESESDSLYQLIMGMTALTVDLIVEFCDYVPGFRHLDNIDQQVIIKECSSEVTMLKAARRYMRYLKYNIYGSHLCGRVTRRKINNLDKGLQIILL